jgi:hypothetical protein
MTQDELKEVILKAQCCVSDMAFKALREEMYLKGDSKSTFINVRFAHALIGVLNRYYDVVYTLEDEPCFSDITSVIEQIQILCNNCGCCVDRETLLKDI